MKRRLSFLLLLISFTPTAFAQTGAHNTPIDLTLVAPQEPITDSAVFDESVIFSPNFAINQTDPALSDLFDPNDASKLCFPTSLAEVLTYLYGYHAPLFNRLALSGLSADNKTLDPNALIRQLAGICQTDSVNGTNSLSAIQCISTLIHQSGYGLGNTSLISPFNPPAPSVPIQNRQVSISDIRAALKSGDPVILEVAWFALDPTTKVWTRANGHYVSVYGYDYDKSWGDDEIQLKVINPVTNYGTSRANALYDTITVQRYSPQAGMVYPPNRPYIVSGAGFGGSTKRGFLGMMIRVSPAINP